MFIKPHQLIRLFYPSIIWKRNKKKTLWLTFDDGPNPKITEWILSILKLENIPATFFLVGENIERFPKLFKQIKENGHQIGNHSYSHLNGWSTNYKSYIQDVEKCQILMPENKLFRPPFGKISPIQIRKLKKKYKIVMWDILSYDFAEKNQNILKSNILKNIEDGSIIVFHNNQKSFEILKKGLTDIIYELKKKGYAFSNSW